MTSLSWESSKKQRPNPAVDYGPPPRLPYATKEQLAVYREEQTVKKQSEFLSGNYFKKPTSKGSFEKDLNVSLLEKNFRNYSSFLELETTADETQLWNTSEKTSRLTLSRFPDFLSSSSSAHSAPTIVSNPVFSSSEDPFGERLEPLIPDYLPDFLLGDEELFEKKPLEDSFQSPSFDSQDPLLEQLFTMQHAESFPEKPPTLSPISQSSLPLAEEKTQTRNIKKRSSSSLRESFQIGDGISPIKVSPFSRDYLKLLENASQAETLINVYERHKTRLIQHCGPYEGDLLRYSTFIEHVRNWDTTILPQISDGTSPIKLDSDEFKKIAEIASTPLKKQDAYDEFTERLLHDSGKFKGEPISYFTFSNLVSDYWKIKNLKNIRNKTKEINKIKSTKAIVIKNRFLK